MRTRNADSASKSATPKKTPPPRKSAAKATGESPAAKRTPTASRTRSAKKTESSPAPDPISDSNQDQTPPEKKSLASASATKSVRKKAPGRPRTKAVATPNLGEELEAEAEETSVVGNVEAEGDVAPVVDDAEAAEEVEKPGDVEVVDTGNIESEKEGEQGLGSVELSDEKGQKSMEVDEPFVLKVCGLAEMGRSVIEVDIAASDDASVGFKQPEHAIVDLNVSTVDNEDLTGAKEVEEELKEQKGEEVLNEKNEEKGEEELKEQEGERGEEDLKELEGEKGEDGLKELEAEKGEEGLKKLEGEKGGEELKGQEGEKGKEELKEEEHEKAKVDETNIFGHEELSNIDSKVEVKVQLQKDVNSENYDGDGPKSGEMLDSGERGTEEPIEEDPEEDPEETETLEEHSNPDSKVEVKVQLQKDVNSENYGGEGPKSGEIFDSGEQGTEEPIEEDLEENPEETETLEEHMELEALARQRKIKKEHEIFVGGLDRDATEEDLRKVFQRIGEVVEVRLHKNSSTNKNKGYAFVKFANKEHAKKALSEMKNPVIHGKRCGIAPSEDNDTLFLGNICNTWTKEAIKQKLMDYGIEGAENITLVSDVQHEGLSRGFAFLEFSCHADAMHAYKRLQKPDVIFGHAERTAKVAFAEPVREPDPEIMAQVKSVFINGLPPHWEEDHVRELFKSYGEIVRIVLARSMSTAKRKDYGFIDFSTHEAAVACVDGVNKSELGDGASKIKLRARLSNPLPKTQAVKGGMCGGFRIGHARSGAFPRSGRGFGRGRQPFNNRGNVNRNRSFYHTGHSHSGRMGSRSDLDFNMHPDFRQRQFGSQAGAMRGGHYAGSRGAAFAGPSRHYQDRAWYGMADGGPSEPIPPRRPYSPGGQFDSPFMGRRFDDPYLYDDNMHGMKRPFYMTDPEPDYMGPNMVRPRLDYADPSVFHGTRYHDSFGASSRQYPPGPPQDYFASDYGRGLYSSFYQNDGSHGRGRGHEHGHGHGHGYY